MSKLNEGDLVLYLGKELAIFIRIQKEEVAVIVEGQKIVIKQELSYIFLTEQQKYIQAFTKYLRNFDDNTFAK